MRATTIAPFTIALMLLSAAAAAATYDLSGGWAYSTSNHTSAGVCPAGSDSQGALTIAQTGDTFTLTIDSGMVCVPASMCAFSGTVSGAEYVGSSSDVVDDEGGVVDNLLTFTASSVDAASGHDLSTYTLADFSCSWEFDLSMTRAGDGGGGGEAGGGEPGGDGGGGSSSSSSTSGESRRSGGDDDGGCAMASPSSEGDDLGTLLFLLGVGLLSRRRR